MKRKGKKPDPEEPHLYKVMRGETPSILSFAAQSPPAPTLEEDDHLLLLAAKRVFSRKRLESLVNRVKSLEKKASRSLDTAKRPKKPKLWYFVHECKQRHPDKSSDHGFIASYVDRIWEKRKQDLQEVCPKSWRHVPNPPRSLMDALNSSVLKKRVRSWISRVQ